jgi:hypothetical protein
MTKTEQRRHFLRILSAFNHGRRDGAIVLYSYLPTTGQHDFINDARRHEQNDAAEFFENLINK